MRTNWDIRFIELAAHIAQWSKDPSTKAGAVIVDDSRRVVAMGYNGFPRGVADRPDRLADRDLKYQMVVHAEANAVLNALGSARGATMYMHPFRPCSECSKTIIQAGIRAVLFPEWIPVPERWLGSMALSIAMLEEAGVDVRAVPRPSPHV